MNRHIYVRELIGEIRMAIIHDQESIEAERLALARNGDEVQFSELTEPYRRELQVHCYRILGSLHEAEDLVQESMLKAWKRLDSFEGRASFRSWLYKIATNSCLDFLDQKKSRRLLPFDKLSPSNPATPILPPTPEITWLEPFPDEWLGDKSAINPEARYSDSESISLAFLAALQTLPARQRAVLILRDVLDFSANETSDLLELTVSAVNSALHRARTTLSQRYPRGTMEDSIMSATDERTQQLLDHFVQAWEHADVDGLVALLKADAALAMPPSPSWYQGNAAIGVFAATTIFADDAMFPGKALNRWKLLPTRANGSPAFAIYQCNEQDTYKAFGLIALVVNGDKLSQIISFIDPSLPPLFGFPMTLVQS
jgi:RNA polymerase sigma-70 factor (ECF subfamily)